MKNALKATLRIPTAEQYAYIEVEVEDTPEQIVELYQRFTALVKNGAGKKELLDSVI